MIRVFDIQRGSFVDGPGIRTTIFLKGCNLHCRWCHNPESWAFEPQILFYTQRCTHCGTCAAVCQHDGIVNPQKCICCGACTTACPNGARTICGRDYTESELFALAKQDLPFFKKTNGGITVSGGECMLQAKMLEKFLCMCHAAGIHTAVDTAGNVSFSEFERILPYTDLFLYDIKMMDARRHKEYTGVDNNLILDNLKKLSAHNTKIWIRVPIIRGVNDTAEEMTRIGTYLQEIHPQRIELLPYHPMGLSKYRAAFHKEAVAFSAPSAAAMAELSQRVQKEAGI